MVYTYKILNRIKISARDILAYPAFDVTYCSFFYIVVTVASFMNNGFLND